jgi:hypothetical protein
MHNGAVRSPQDDDKTLITPPHLAAPGEISYTRPLPWEQERIPKTVALPSGEYSDPSLTSRVPVPSRRKPESMVRVLALSMLVFLFTATIGFALVWLLMG